MSVVQQAPKSGVVVIRLNRPERLNAINHAMLADLTEAFADLPADTRAVVLTGEGRGFCSGLDVRAFGSGIPEADDPAIDRLRFQQAMAALPQAIRDLPQPVIAAVNGRASARGWRCASRPISGSVRRQRNSETRPSCWGSRVPRWG